MSKQTNISVIIPARNRPEYTTQAIESVLNQEIPAYVTLEIIVVDNRSTPPLKELLGSKFPQVKFIVSRGYDSPGGTRNFGLKHAKGDYIAFLDNDDQWMQPFIKDSLDAIKEKKIAITTCLSWPYIYGEYPAIETLKLIFLNLVRNTVLFWFWLTNHRKLPANGFYLCQISHLLFKREFLKGVKFNEKAVAAEDWEFFVEATKRLPIRLIFKPLVKFRYSWTSNTNTELVRAKKWSAYQNLIKKLPRSYKKGLLHKLFLLYIRSFGN